MPSMSPTVELHTNSNDQVSIQVTEAAIAQVDKAVTTKGSGLGIRIGVKPRGCSGMSYVVELLEQSPTDQDYVFPLPNQLMIAMEKSACDKYLKGIVVDFARKGLAGEQFTFLNPNETGACGCGESFMVDEE
jgi:iron-sulfur cluster assembly protein